MTENAGAQKDQLDIFSGQLKTLTDHNIQKLDKINETVEKKLAGIQEDNNKKLEQMRATVDEKLHDTLEKRLGESFKIVSDRLEQVHKGLGEMRSRHGVGDLKRFTNIRPQHLRRDPAGEPSWSSS
jgi:DNA recombination protein RmuC